MHGRAALAPHDARVIGVRAVYPFGKRAGAATEIALPRFLKQPPYIRSALATASAARSAARTRIRRSEEHTSELQSLMRISYAVFCLKKKKLQIQHQNKTRILTVTS